MSVIREMGTMAESWESYSSGMESAAVSACMELRKKYNLQVDNIEIIDCEEECSAYSECCR